MAKLDVLANNTMPKNIKNIDSNFTELYEDTITDVTIDGTSVKSDNTVALETITDTEIDTLFAYPPNSSYLSGTWQINSDPELPSSRISFDNSDGYGYVSCDALGNVTEVSFNTSVITYRQDLGGDVSWINVYNGSSWQDEGYRTIRFSSGSVNQSVLTWLQSNAVKLSN